MWAVVSCSCRKEQGNAQLAGSLPVLCSAVLRPWESHKEGEVVQGDEGTRAGWQQEGSEIGGLQSLAAPTAEAAPGGC